MRTILVQDWLYLRGPNGGDSVAQAEISWVDLADYREVVAWLDVRHVTTDPASGQSAVSVTYQTAPTKEEELLNQLAVVVPASGATTVTPFIPETAPQGPVARWFRWLIVSTSGPWEIEFRLWLAASRPGRKELERQ